MRNFSTLTNQLNIQITSKLPNNSIKYCKKRLHEYQLNKLQKSENNSNHLPSNLSNKLLQINQFKHKKVIARRLIGVFLIQFSNKSN